jgi:hypothetical protein
VSTSLICKSFDNPTANAALKASPAPVVSSTGSLSSNASTKKFSFLFAK